MSVLSRDGSRDSIRGADRQGRDVCARASSYFSIARRKGKAVQAGGEPAVPDIFAANAPAAKNTRGPNDVRPMLDRAGRRRRDERKRRSLPASVFRRAHGRRCSAARPCPTLVDSLPFGRRRSLTPLSPRTTSASSASRRSLPPMPSRRKARRDHCAKTKPSAASGEPPRLSNRHGDIGGGRPFRRSRTRTRRCCAPPGRTRCRSGGPARPDSGTCPRSRAPESAPAPALPASRP